VAAGAPRHVEWYYTDPAAAHSDPDYTDGVALKLVVATGTRPEDLDVRRLFLFRDGRVRLSGLATVDIAAQVFWDSLLTWDADPVIGHPEGPRLLLGVQCVRLEGFATPDAAARAFWQAVARLAPPGWRLEVPAEWGEEEHG
jgi:hypothetical protein